MLLFDTSGNGGLADRLTGLMTALLLAILTDRALALDWPGHEAALTMPQLSGGLDGNAALLSHARAAAAKGEARRLEWLEAEVKYLRRLGTATAHLARATDKSTDELRAGKRLILAARRAFRTRLANEGWEFVEYLGRRREQEDEIKARKERRRAEGAAPGRLVANSSFGRLRDVGRHRGNPPASQKLPSGAEGQ